MDSRIDLSRGSMPGKPFDDADKKGGVNEVSAVSARVGRRPGARFNGDDAPFCSRGLSGKGFGLFHAAGRSLVR